MQLSRMTGRLTTACPGVPECPHESPHAGGHVEVCRPQTAYSAPNRRYAEADPEDEAAPARRGRRWGRYAQADAELVADLAGELRDHLATLRAAGREATP